MVSFHLTDLLQNEVIPLLHGTLQMNIAGLLQSRTTYKLPVDIFEILME